MEFPRMRERVRGDGERLLSREFNTRNALRSESAWCVEGDGLEREAS